MADDFLWDCAMVESSSGLVDERDWLVPGKKEELFARPAKGVSKGRWLVQSKDVDMDGDFCVEIKEIRGDGVLDVIGGELWEASLLLSTFLLANRASFVGQRVLELGSGVGLPGLLLAEMNKRWLLGSSKQHQHQHQQVEICLSDFDPRVLDNLAECAAATAGRPNEKEAEEEALASFSLCVEALDWSDYDQIEQRGQQQQQQQLHLIHQQRFDLAIGSALCYSPDHVCLADTLLHLLHGSCRSIYIIQIKDRPGFARLLRRLEALHVPFVCREVSQDLYEKAQDIGCSIISTSQQQQQQQQQQQHNKNRAAFEEEASVVVLKRFHVPSTFPSSSPPSSATDAHAPKRNLIHTPREAFVLVTIGDDATAATRGDVDAASSAASAPQGNAVVLLLCGAPASGKSSLAKALAQQHELLTTAAGSDENEGGGGSSAVGGRSVLISFDDKQEAIEAWDAHTFSASRRRALDELERVLSSCSSSSSPAASTVVLVDDIMYLSSMRREVYVLARKHLVPLVVVWVQTDLTTALARNSLRPAAQKVEDATISKILEQFEPPRASNVADRIHFCIETSGVSVDKEQLEALVSSKARDILEALWPLVDQRRAELVEQQQQEQRAAASREHEASKHPSHLLKLDLDCRAAISTVMSSLTTLRTTSRGSGATSPVPPLAMGKVAELLASCKASTMAEARRRESTAASHEQEALSPLLFVEHVEQALKKRGANEPEILALLGSLLSD